MGIKTKIFSVFLRNKLRQLSTWSGLVTWVVAAIGVEMPDKTVEAFANGLLVLAGAAMMFIDEYRTYNPKQLPSVKNARAVGEQLRSDELHDRSKR